MLHIERSASKRLSKSKKQEIDSINERLDVLLESMRRVTSMPKKQEMKAEVQRLKERLKELKTI